jgi:hypothetical protein
VPLFFVAPQDRIDWYVGAGTTIVGIVPLLIAPLDVVEDARLLRARLDARGAGDDVCALWPTPKAGWCATPRTSPTGSAGGCTPATSRSTPASAWSWRSAITTGARAP